MFDVSRSGYYRFINSPVSKRAKENKMLIEKIKEVHIKSRQTYGSPRIQMAVSNEEEYYSRNRIARIMKKEGIQAKMQKRFKVTTTVNPKAKAAPNLLNQNFVADKPNQRWVADVTYITTAQGWLYVAAVLDLFSRRIVGLAMGERNTAELVIKALKQALIHRNPEPGLIHHSDKGTQYTSYDFQVFLKKNEITVSMSGTGNCYDNAAMESFFHTLKTEHVHFEHYVTREQAKVSIFEYIEVFYNQERLHSTLGYLSPAQYEEMDEKHKVLLHL